MKEIDKILAQVEDCIRNNKYFPVETEMVELKPTPPSLNQSAKALESICAFLNTKGGILILGIEDIPKQQKYVLKGYSEHSENLIKSYAQIFTNKAGVALDLSQYMNGYVIKDVMDKRVCVIYVDGLPDDQKYVYFENVAYERKLTGDHKIGPDQILRHEEFKEEISNKRELEPVDNATLADIDIDKLNEYIEKLNKEVKTETYKPDTNSALPFLTRKRFVLGDKVTTLGALVCINHIKDFLGWKAQVDGFVEIEYDVAQDKRSIVDNVIPLMEKSYGYVVKNIQVGVSIENGGTSMPEYPLPLIRETINNAIAHRDYNVDKYININIKPNKYIEIRNPGAFKKQLLLESVEHDIPFRRIIPDSKPRNPKLADVLKVFDKWEGKARGMSNLVNEALNNKIDLPYYRFYSENDLGLFIQKGKLIDDSFIATLKSFDIFIKTKLNGTTLTNDEKAVLAYLFKSEKANHQYRYTILLTPDNNHFDALRRLAQSGLIYKHPESPQLYPIYLVHRNLMQEDYINELREVFGGSFDALPEIHKKVLSLIYQINNFGDNNSLSATKAGRILYTKTGQPENDIKSFDNFKRKIYDVFKKLTVSGFIINNDNKYLINTDFKRTASTFD